MNFKAAMPVQAKTENKKNEKTETSVSKPLNLNSVPHYKPAFKGASIPLAEITEEQFESACEYLNERKAELAEKDAKIYPEKFDVKKLEGIQKGIEVFEGMSFKEISAIADRFHGILINRGCKNGCGHCFADAKKHIERMSFEDFQKFTGGFQELNERLGYNVFHHQVNLTQYHTTFYDSDCSDITLKDKDGKVHDLIEINDMLHKTTKRPVLFDTHGWNVKHPTTVDRVRKYIDFYSKPENAKLLHGFNLSLDPFHDLNARSVEFLESDPDRSKKFRKLYIERMSNVMFDLTPIAQTPKFHIFPLCVEDGSTKTKHFKKNEFDELYKEIKEKLTALYEEDLASENPKFVKSEEDIQKYLDKYDSHIKNNLRNALPKGRAANLYNEKDMMTQVVKSIQKEKDGIMKMLKTPLSHGDFGIMVDVNGKTYLGDENDIYPMETAFNFDNKDKESAPIGPVYHPERPITKEELN